jgi:putative AdoMet-dependent methyltransferase
MLNSKGFDLWADKYDESVELSEKDYPFAGYNEVLNTVYKVMKSKQKAKVLDIGFGTGILTTKLYEEGYFIYGVDFSTRMIEIAKPKMPNAHLFLYDLKNGLPEEIKNMHFDFIISTYAIHHLMDSEKTKFLTELTKLLAKDGEIIVGDIAFETRDSFEKCRSEYKEIWDDEEFYIIFSEFKDNFLDYKIKYKPVSFCSGIISLK